jgi:predicted dehydrogenase
MIQAALESSKHVLSQKPFVLDLDTGQKLVDFADKQNVKLAVNQNARWAPHYSYIRQAIAAGHVGQILSAHLSVHWDHNWIAGTAFDNVRHIVLYDFAIHWFDLIACFFAGHAPIRVYATTARSPAQKAKPTLLGQAVIEFDSGQASLSFDADAKFGPQDRTYIAGTEGTLTSLGKDFTKQTVTLYTKRGVAKPKLRGTWFPDGFHGTMAELLRSIEQNREPQNSARNNLPSLALCFAAVESAETGTPQVPGQVKSLRQ